jgi:hypothetical protein
LQTGTAGQTGARYRLILADQVQHDATIDVACGFALYGGVAFAQILLCH